MLFAKNVLNEINISRNIEISKRLHELELSKRSKHQTIHFRIRFQREQWNHQLIFKAFINRDVIYLWDRIHRTNVNRERNYLITKSDDSADMWRPIFSNDNNIREQSKSHCSDQEFSISRTNKAHRYLIHFIKEKKIKDFIDLIYVFIDQMIIDDLTKLLISDKFIQFRLLLKIE